MDSSTSTSSLTVVAANNDDVSVDDGTPDATASTRLISNPPRGAQSSYAAVFKDSMKLTVPIALTRIIDMGRDFIAAMIIAEYSASGRATVPIIAGFKTSVVFSCSALLWAQGVVLGKAYGMTLNPYLPEEQRDELQKSIGEIIRQGWLLSIPLSIPPMVFFALIKPVMLVLQQTNEHTQIADAFFKTYLWSIPGSMMITASRQAAFTLDRQLIPFIIGLYDMAVIYFLGYGLVYGKWWLPKIGIPGLGIAYMVQNYTGLLLYKLAFFGIKDFRQNYKLFRLGSIKEFKHFKELLRVGWPIAVNVMGELSALFATTVVAGWFKETELKAQAVVSQYVPLAIMPLVALSQAAAMRVAKHHGMSQNSAVRRYAFVNMSLGAMLSIVYFALSWFPKLLAYPFIPKSDSDYQEVIGILRVLLVIQSVSLFFNGQRDISVSALRGLQDTLIPMIISLGILLLAGLPLSIGLGYVLGLDVIGLGIGYSVGLAGGAVGNGIRWIRQSTDRGLETIRSRPPEQQSNWGQVRTLFCCFPRRGLSQAAPEGRSDEEQTRGMRLSVNENE